MFTVAEIQQRKENFKSFQKPGVLVAENEFPHCLSDTSLPEVPGKSGNGRKKSASNALCADRRIPHPIAFYYFEIEVVHAGPSEGLAIGICEAGYHPNKLLGCYRYAFSLKSDGNKHTNISSDGDYFCEKFGTGDTVGCGIDLESGDIFYTLNGKYLGVAFEGSQCNRNQFPKVWLQSKAVQVQANFGQLPFQFDIASHLQRNTQQANPPIATPERPRKRSSTPTSLPPTPKAMKTTPDTNASAMNKISEEIKCGRITEAMAGIEANYPNFLAANKKLKFLLELQQFFEAAQLNGADAAPASSSSHVVEQQSVNLFNLYTKLVILANLAEPTDGLWTHIHAASKVLFERDGKNLLTIRTQQQRRDDLGSAVISLIKAAEKMKKLDSYT